MPRVVTSSAASRDLLQIWLYIAADSTRHADLFLDKVDAELHRVCLLPGAGRGRDELRPGMRSLPVGNYLLFYRVIDDGVELVRVVHGARHLKRQFGERD